MIQSVAEFAVAQVRIHKSVVSRALEQHVYFYDFSDWMHLTIFVFSSLIFLQLRTSHDVQEYLKWITSPLLSWYFLILSLLYLSFLICEVRYLKVFLKVMVFNIWKKRHEKLSISCSSTLLHHCFLFFVFLLLLTKIFHISLFEKQCENEYQ